MTELQLVFITNGRAEIDFKAEDEIANVMEENDAFISFCIPHRE